MGEVRITFNGEDVTGKEDAALVPDEISIDRSDESMRPEAKKLAEAAVRKGESGDEADARWLSKRDHNKARDNMRKHHLGELSVK